MARRSFSDSSLKMTGLFVRRRLRSCGSGRIDPRSRLPRPIETKAMGSPGRWLLLADLLRLHVEGTRFALHSIDS